MLIALAIPMPSRSPSTRSTRRQSRVALARAVDRVVAGDLVALAPAAGRGTTSGRARAASRASRSSARPDASASSEPGCGNVPGRPARRRDRSSPISVWPSSARARRAAVELAVEHEPAADAGADREHHEVLADDLAVDLNASASAAHDASFST